jgi:dihydroxy-acid dehydratase
MALIAIPGCDKNMPGIDHCNGKIESSFIMLYGGTIAAGHYKGQDLNIISGI